MKKILLLLSAVVFTLNASAKKVKFVVDMQGYILATAGIHVMGDWQTAAGDTNGNWFSGSQLMKALDSTSTVYELVVDIPAFTKYEYVFVNGDQSYEIEFVPDPCRVNPELGGANTNRWFYLDSLNADTTTIGGFIFGGTAPASKFFVRWLLDIKNTTAGTDLPHIIGSFNSWSTTALPMYSFGGTVYDNYTYIDSGAFEYRFLKDNTVDEKNTLQGTCVNAAGNRNIANASDIVLNKVCFAQCDSNCFVLGANDLIFSSTVHVTPTLTTDFVNISSLETLSKSDVLVFDITGRQCTIPLCVKNTQSTSVDFSALPAHLYFLQVKGKTFRIQKL
jgi:hypothetical protein